MKALLICLVFALVTAAPVFAWNEPDSFMGVKFWRPINEGTLPQCGPDAEIKQPRKPCWEKFITDENSHNILNVAIGDFFMDIQADSLNGKVAHLHIVFFQADYGTILLTFKERYGAPTSIKTETLQNGFGAKFKNEIVKWEGKRLNITIDKFGLGTSKGTIDYDTDIWQQHSGRKFQEDIKKKAKTL